jgi:endonuclease-3
MKNVKLRVVVNIFQMASKKEVTTALKRLKRRFPTPGAMEFGDAYQSLVAVLLTARTRDEQVLKLLPGFFKAYPTVQKLAKATPAQIEKKINTIGMYRQKAKNLSALGKRVVNEYGGEIPDTLEELITLAGVGRKTASVILPYQFNKPAIAVDTHVHRVTNRLGWVKTKTTEKTEQALLDLIPSELYATVNQVFVKHGRYICIKNPRCWACPLADVCKFKGKQLAVPKKADEILADIERRELVLQKLREQVI